jgi:hypothetical protein
LTISRDEYLADQKALLAVLTTLFKAVQPMIEAANTRDEVAVGAKVQRAAQNLEEARQALGRYALRPRVSEFLEEWSEEELAVLRDKLGMVDADEDDEDDDG